MRRVSAILLAAALLTGMVRPSFTEGGDGGGEQRDAVEAAVDQLALILTFNQLTSAPTQIILLAQNDAFAMLTNQGVKKIVEGGGGLVSLFKSNKQKIFEHLARENFVNKVGKAYRIGDMVFADKMFFDVEFTPDVTQIGQQALAMIQSGETFALGPSRDPLTDILATNIAVMAILFRQASGMRTIYQLDLKMNKAGGISGVDAGKPLNHPLAYFAFFAAIASGKAEFIGNVWQIEDKVFVAAPLDEIFPKKPGANIGLDSLPAAR